MKRRPIFLMTVIFLQLTAASASAFNADLTADGDVDGADLAVFAADFNADELASFVVFFGAAGYFPGDQFQAWEGGPAYYQRWPAGPFTDFHVFPIAVWLQTPANANAYKAIGINHFIGLWQGPNESQLSSLKAAAMPVFCDQNAVGLNSVNNSIIKAWTHQDEPDNAQWNSGGWYDPPILPSVVVARYQAMQAADATRPVFLNLGQGVAWDMWYGRGTRTNHPEDYPLYALGADILSYDIYPVNSTHTDVKEKLWLVAYGVDRLRTWSNYGKPVWVWIETTKISAGSNRRPTPAEVKAEVWMAIVHGARGIGYFCHKWDPFVEAGLLSDPEMRAGVSAVNAQISTLAPILNTPSVAGAALVTTSNPAVPVDVMIKRASGCTYLFAVAMGPENIVATFTLNGFTGFQAVEVISESRQISATNGVFQDGFTGYGVHIYKLPNS